jgi:hypothetical protein
LRFIHNQSLRLLRTLANPSWHLMWGFTHRFLIANNTSMGRINSNSRNKTFLCPYLTFYSSR